MMKKISRDNMIAVSEKMLKMLNPSSYELEFKADMKKASKEAAEYLNKYLDSLFE